MNDNWLREPVLLDAYRRYLESQDTVGFVHAVSKRYTPSSLERLATNADCETRRAAIFALGFKGDYQANQTVGRALQDEDAGVRQLAEIACRCIWNRVGDAPQRRQLADIVRLNAARRYRDAVEQASVLLELAPGFAEAWYQRATAWFQLGDFAQAISDWYQALEHNPYHFVAATAIGNAYLQLHNPVSALESFRRALRLNPDLEHVRAQIAALRRQIEER
ncbi:MAG: HEAT repeat domain-containing protein [Pirellulaceae bacterium]